MNFGATIFFNTSVVFAYSATAYDFTDELEEDRVGIGFTWNAEDRILNITGIKNNSAILKLPENSTIDIQGNIENTIGGLICNGNLLIKGNNTASLNVTGCNCSTPIGYLSCMSIYDTLTINNGTVHIEVKEGFGIRGKSNINGGNIEVITDTTYSAFKEVPSINPTIDWKISYSNNNETEEIEADITDIYNIYNSSIIKISKVIMIGDIDEDGKVNIKDLNRLYEYLKETSELTEQELKYADVNGDGKVNIKDWNRLYEHISEVNPLF